MAQVLPSDPFGGFKWPFQGLSMVKWPQSGKKQWVISLGHLEGPLGHVFFVFFFGVVRAKNMWNFQPEPPNPQIWDSNEQPEEMVKINEWRILEDGLPGRNVSGEENHPHL